GCAEQGESGGVRRTCAPVHDHSQGSGAMMRWLAALAFLGGLLCVTPVFAHEVRPAYLEIDQTSATTYKLIWKLPTMGDVAIHLEPHISNGWLDQKPADQYAAAGFLIRTWIVAD